MTMTPFGPDVDTRYMNVALAQARRAARLGEVPVGAVLVDVAGVVVARGYNLVERYHTQCAHAEMRLIQRVSKQRGDWRLDGHWLYVTLEPCGMCMGLIVLSRLAGVVFGASSPLFGYGLSTGSSSVPYRKGSVVVIAGVGAQEATALLKQFFQHQRKNKN